MAALVSDWLRHFRLLIWHRWTEFNKNLTGSKISTSSTKFVFFGPIRKTRWPPWPLNGWDIFDVFSETAQRNSMKLDKKLDLNVLYQVCVFRADRKSKIAAPASDWPRHFSPSRLKPLNRIQRNLTESKISLSFTMFVLFGPIGKTRWPPWPLIGWYIFDFSSETAKQNSIKTWQKARSQRPLPSLCFSGRSEKQDGRPGLWLAKTFFAISSETFEQNSTKPDRKQDLIVLYHVSVFRDDQKNKISAFRDDRKNKMAALASDCLRHFRLLLWNRWTEFNETLQEARSQCPLPSSCFSGRSEKQDSHPGLWLAETFVTSPLKPLNRIQRNLTGSKISTSSTNFVFFGPICKQKLPHWPIVKKVAHWTQVHDMWPFGPLVNTHQGGIQNSRRNGQLMRHGNGFMGKLMSNFFLFSSQQKKLEV